MVSALNESQFGGYVMRYEPPEMGRDYHTVRAFHEVEGHRAHMGDLLWNSKQVLNVGVGEQFQRRGVATAMWNHAQSLASSNARIPAPKHSPDRTKAGDAWARSVGGRLPRKTEFRASIGEPRPAGDNNVEPHPPKFSR